MEIMPRRLLHSEDVVGRLLDIAARAHTSYEEESAKLRRLEHQKTLLPDNATDEVLRQLVTDIEVCKARCELLRSEMQRAEVEAQPARDIQAAKEKQHEIAVATTAYEGTAKLVAECYSKLKENERLVNDLERARQVNARTFAELQLDLAKKKTRLKDLGVSV